MYDSAAMMIQIAAHDFPDRYRSAINVNFELLTVSEINVFDYCAVVLFVAANIRES